MLVSLQCAVRVHTTFCCGRHMATLPGGWGVCDGAGEVAVVCVGVWSRRLLAMFAIGSENRGNVGQLCHSFEVGTACL